MGKNDLNSLSKRVKKIEIMLNEKHPEVVSNVQFLISALKGQQKFISEMANDRDRAGQAAQMFQSQLKATQVFLKEKKLEEEYKTFMEDMVKKQGDEADKKRKETEEKLVEQQKKLKELDEKEKGGEDKNED